MGGAERGHVRRDGRLGADRRVERQVQGAGEQGQGGAGFRLAGWCVGGGVDGVAKDGAAEQRAVDADLVGAAGGRVQFEQGDAGVRGQQAPGGAGGIAGGAGVHAPAGLRRSFGEGGVDLAARGGGGAGDQSPVGFAHAALGEGLLGGDERGFGEGDGEAAGGVRVQAVGEPGAVLAAGEEGEEVFDARATGGARVDGEAGGFVYDDDTVVAEELGGGIAGCGWGHHSGGE